VPVARRGDGYSAKLSEVHARVNEPTSPACGAFGTCGGCLLQHAPEDLYRAWKTALVSEALSRRGFEAPSVRPMQSFPLGTRRRATFRGIRDGGRFRLGFNRRMSDRVVALESCPLLTPALNELLARSTDMPGRPGRVIATDVEGGLDIILELAEVPDLGLREDLAAFAEQLDVARLSWQPAGEAPEPLSLRREPVVRFAEVPVSFPPGGFLQPSIAGEQCLTEAVLNAVEGTDHVADLFGGLGTFTFALARDRRVHLAEVDAAAVAAAQRAAGQAGLGGRIEAERRDLDQRPLSAKELDRFDAVVFDPPRAGAAAQAAEIAASKTLCKVIAVSCNPATFARDARSLCDGGFRLTEVTPVDQFPWSAHLEIVGIFAR